MRHLPLHAALLAGLLAGASLPIHAQALDDSLRSSTVAGPSDHARAPVPTGAVRVDPRCPAVQPALPLRRPEGGA